MSLSLLTVLCTIGGVAGSKFLEATSNQTANKIINQVGSNLLQEVIKKTAKTIKETAEELTGNDKK